MTPGFLDRLVARSVGPVAGLVPQAASRFEPGGLSSAEVWAPAERTNVTGPAADRARNRGPADPEPVPGVSPGLGPAATGAAPGMGRVGDEPGPTVIRPAPSGTTSAGRPDATPARDAGARATPRATPPQPEPPVDQPVEQTGDPIGVRPAPLRRAEPAPDPVPATDSAGSAGLNRAAPSIVRSAVDAGTADPAAPDVRRRAADRAVDTEPEPGRARASAVGDQPVPLRDTPPPARANSAPPVPTPVRSTPPVTVHVSIGRIVVRTLEPAAARPRRPTGAPRPALGLDDYLRRADRGRR